MDIVADDADLVDYLTPSRFEWPSKSQLQERYVNQVSKSVIKIAIATDIVKTEAAFANFLNPTTEQFGEPKTYHLCGKYVLRHRR